MIKLLCKNFPGRQYPILIVHIFYFVAAAAMSFVYYHKIIEPVDFYTDEYGGVFRVLNLDAVSTIQFRFLVPLFNWRITLYFGYFSKSADVVLHNNFYLPYFYCFLQNY